MARLLAGKALRGFADGFVSLLLPLYLLELGYTPLDVGLVATATLLGSGLLALAVGSASAARYQPRTLLLAACVLMGATGIAVASVHAFWPLLLIAFAGTLNPSGGDVSVFLPLEHALLAKSVQDRSRTRAFAYYSLAGTLAGACGALAAAVPSSLQDMLGVSRIVALQSMFVVYALFACAAALVYRGLPRAAAGHAEPRTPLGPSKQRVWLLAGLFSLDAFAGGLVVQSLLVLWLFQRFGMSPEMAGAIFFATGVLSALSYLAAARIADRFGLVRTMVFSHLPANVCLIAIPFCTELAWVVALLFVRGALSQMDVPTRSSYVMAIVTPPERAAAAGVTTVPRSLASAASPALAGWLLGMSGFGWPLVIGGVLKIVYDLLLLAMFHRVKPPEEG